MEAPARTTVNTDDLANFDPNDLSLNITKRNQKPSAGSVGAVNENALSQLR